MLPETENIIVRYLTNSATASDLDFLAEWIKEPINKQIFKEYVDVHFSIYYSMKDPNTQEVLNKLLSTIRKEKKFVFQLKNNPLYRLAAAVVVIGVVVSAYLFTEQFTNQGNVVAEHKSDNQNKIVDIKPGTNKAMLTLEDGSQIALDQDQSFEKQNINCNGQEIVYAKNNSDEIKYNYLTIPRGGEYSILLSDGTRVWLNSETQIRYPVSFKSGEPRKVELVYGEAYFDVSPSTEHKGTKFIVSNKSQEIEVLGTEFNVKAYMGESNVYTTLVEGKVRVDSGNEAKYLKPSEQLVLNLIDNSKTVREVDVFNEISWKEGIFSFENESLKKVMRVLSRWYDVDFVFKNKDVGKEEFIGVLRKNLKLQDVLTNIENLGIIKKFEIYDRKVILE